MLQRQDTVGSETGDRLCKFTLKWYIDSPENGSVAGTADASIPRVEKTGTEVDLGTVLTSNNSVHNPWYSDQKAVSVQAKSNTSPHECGGRAVLQARAF